MPTARDSPGSGVPGSVRRLAIHASGTRIGVVTYSPIQIQKATLSCRKRSRCANEPIAMKIVNAVTGRKPTWMRWKRCSKTTRAKKYAPAM